MNKTLILVACVLVLGLTATNARADIVLTGVTDATYLGFIKDGVPSSQADDVGYINNLITVPANTGPVTIGTESYNRTGSSLAGPFPSAVLAGNTRNTPGTTGSLLTGFTYLTAKYDGPNAGVYVWDVSGQTGIYTVPAKLPNVPNEFKNGKLETFGLSEVTLFNPTAVPDSGVTLMLLGGALVGLETLRRRLRA
jgi:hypothetical protein